MGLEGAIAGALGFALLRPSALRRAAWPFAASIPAGLLVGGAAALLRPGAASLSPAALAPLHAAAHLYALALAALALLARGRSADELGTSAWRGVAELAALSAGLLLLLPEGAFLAARLADLALLRGAVAPVAAGAALGLAAAALLGAAAAWLWLRAGAGAALSPSSVLSLLLALELAGIAAVAVDAHTLPAALTGAVARLVHDGLHLVFVVLQLPDHAFLESWAYQAILRLLDPGVHAALAALAVGAVVAAAWAAFLARPAPAPDPATRPPARRLARARSRRARRLGALPFAAALGLAVLAIGAARAGEGDLYDPLPAPVVDDGQGGIPVPLGDPLRGADDRMRKWVYLDGGTPIVFFTIRRPDGTVAAALDLCEVCAPRGYAQLGKGYVFCKYCKTPIPLGEVGQPGGCNPIPIPGAVLRGGALVVPRAALVSLWERRMRSER